MGPLSDLHLIGEGDRTVLHSARWAGREVVKKTLHLPAKLRPELAAQLRAAFEREAAALGRLRHPNLVELLEAGQDARDDPFVLLAAVPGAVRLDQAISRGLASPAAAASIEQLAHLLQAAHEADLVHGLLSPDDVLMDAEGRPVLTGLLRGQRELGERMGRGPSLQALLFAAPEVLAGHAPGPAADVYGLGVLLYTALAGRSPAISGAPLDAASRLTTLPLPPSRHVPHVDPALEAICMRCLALTPGGRFPSARAVANALAEARGAAPQCGQELGAEEIGGRYRLLEELGRGGMAHVYRARDLRLERDVALKLVKGGADGAPPSDNTRARFQREVALLARLDHPNVIKVLDAGEHRGRPFLVMDIIDGVSLQELAEKAPLDGREAARLMAQVARALHHAHQKGVVHRDLKPANVLVRADGQAWLIDLGLGKSLLEASAVAITKRWTLVGTPAFLSPEQVHDSSLATPAADLFGLGLTLWATLTGRSPFEKQDLPATIQAILHEPLPSLRALRPDVSPVLEAICRRCLERDPRRRYESALALAEDLELVARSEVGGPPSPAAAPPPQRSRKGGSTARTLRISG